jgi:hypothetical protein
MPDDRSSRHFLTYNFLKARFGVSIEPRLFLASSSTPWPELLIISIQHSSWDENLVDIAICGCCRFLGWDV